MSWNTTFEECVRKAVRGIPVDAPVTADLPLRAYGLDSLGMVALAGSLEDAFDISFPDEALVPATFGTPGTLWEAVRPLIT